MSEAQTILMQMEAMFKKFMTQPAFENSKTIVAGPSVDRRKLGFLT